MDELTYIPVATEQTPLPYSVIAISNVHPTAKGLVAMFKFEDDRDAFIKSKNEADG